MKIAILSSFPLADKQSYKINFLENLIKRDDISDIILIYSHKSIMDHYIEFKERKRSIGFSSPNKNINLIDSAKNVTLKEFAQKNGIRVYSYKRFSEIECIKLLQDYKPDLAFNLSGKFIPESVLKIPKIGIFSAHYGKLPEIRGSDTIKWSIYLDFPMYVTHYILSPILDMGDIVLLSKVPVYKGDLIYDIRKRCQELAWKGHIKVLDLINKNEIKVLKQTKEMGTTYYRMGKLLTKKVEEILKNNRYSHYEQ